MIALTLTHFDKSFSIKGENIFLKAERQAVTKAIKDGRTFTSKEIRGATYLKNKDMSQSLGMKLPGATAFKIIAKLFIKGKKFPLFRFMQTKPDRKRGSYFASEFERGRTVINPNAFLAIPTRGKNTGFKSAYVRVGDARLPIKRIFSPSVAELSNQMRIPARLDTFIDATLKPEYYRLVNLYLGKGS